MDTQIWPNRPEPDGVSVAAEPPSWRVIVAALAAAFVIMGLTASAAFATEYVGEEIWLATAEIEYRGDSLVETIAVALNSPGVWGPIAVEKENYFFKVTKINPEETQEISEVEEQIKQQILPTKEQEALSAFFTDYNAKWRTRTFCAEVYVVAR